MRNKCGNLVLHYMIVGISLEWLFLNGSLLFVAEEEYFFYPLLFSPFFKRVCIWEPGLKKKVRTFQVKHLLEKSMRSKTSRNEYFSLNFSFDLTSYFGLKYQLFLLQREMHSPMKLIIISNI